MAQPWKWNWSECGVGTVAHCETGALFWVTRAGWIELVRDAGLLPDQVQQVTDALRHALRAPPATPFQQPDAELLPQPKRARTPLPDSHARRRQARPPRRQKKTADRAVRKDFSGFDFRV
jgi:hypothetical protein